MVGSASTDLGDSELRLASRDQFVRRDDRAQLLILSQGAAMNTRTANAKPLSKRDCISDSLVQSLR